MTWCLTHQQDAKACKFCHFVPTPPTDVQRWSELNQSVDGTALLRAPAALVDRTGWFTPIHWER